MIARPATITDLAVGQEVIYVPSSEYRPPRPIHGTVVGLFDVVAGSSPSAAYRPVLLRELDFPVRMFVENALFIIGS